MAKLLYHTTHGTDNPTSATLTFVAANGAKRAGHEAVIALFSEATYLMKDVIVDSVIPIGQPPLKEVMAETISYETPIHV